MISIPGSLSFAKLVMMSSAPVKSVGMPDTHPRSIHCPIQSRLQSVLGVHSFYVECSNIIIIIIIIINFFSASFQRSKVEFLECRASL